MSCDDPKSADLISACSCLKATKDLSDKLAYWQQEIDKYNKEYLVWKNEHNQWVKKHQTWKVKRDNKKTELENEVKLWNNCTNANGAYTDAFHKLLLLKHLVLISARLLNL